MYTALKGQSNYLKKLLAKNATIDLQTTEPGPLLDFKVPKKYTTMQNSTDDEEDEYEQGFT